MAAGEPPPSGPNAAQPAARGLKPTPGQVLVVTSVMFTFISFWRTAAIVLRGPIDAIQYHEWNETG